MGASGWRYRVDYDDVERALAALQERTLADGEYYWPEGDAAYPDEEVPRRPLSVRQLTEWKETNEYEFWTWGTHSILDIDRIDPAEEAEHDGAVRPLGAVEVRELLGSDRPTVEDLEAAYDRDGALGIRTSRWCGRCTALYQGGDRPHQLAFWGVQRRLTPAVNPPREGRSRRP